MAHPVEDRDSHTYDWAELPTPPSRASVRRLMDRVLPTQTDLEAWCIDILPESARRIASFADRLASENLLLQCYDPQELVELLKKWAPERVWKYRRLLQPDSSVHAASANSVGVDAAAPPSRSPLPSIVAAATQPTLGWLVRWAARGVASARRARTFLGHKFYRPGPIAAGVMVTMLVLTMLWLIKAFLPEHSSPAPTAGIVVKLGDSVADDKLRDQIIDVMDPRHTPHTCKQEAAPDGGRSALVLSFDIAKNGLIEDASIHISQENGRMEICLRAWLANLQFSHIALEDIVHVLYPIP